MWGRGKHKVCFQMLLSPALAEEASRTGLPSMGKTPLLAQVKSWLCWNQWRNSRPLQQNQASGSAVVMEMCSLTKQGGHWAREAEIPCTLVRRDCGENQVETALRSLVFLDVVYKDGWYSQHYWNYLLTRVGKTTCSAFYFSLLFYAIYSYAQHEPSNISSLCSLSLFTPESFWLHVIVILHVTFKI